MILAEVCIILCFGLEYLEFFTVFKGIIFQHVLCILLVYLCIFVFSVALFHVRFLRIFL